MHMLCKISRNIKHTCTRVSFQHSFQSQIVGLYKDPDGKNITTFTEKEVTTIDNKAASGNEMKELQRKVVELETSLKQYVRE